METKVLVGVCVAAAVGCVAVGSFIRKQMNVRRMRKDKKIHEAALAATFQADYENVTGLVKGFSMEGLRDFLLETIDRCETDNDDVWFNAHLIASTEIANRYGVC